MRRGPGTLYRRLQSIAYLAKRDRRAALRFAFTSELAKIPIPARLGLIKRFLSITNAVRGYHTLTDMLTIAHAILARASGEGASGPSRPLVIEAGSGYGGSTAKLSLATALAGGSLIVLDTFRGMPENDEEHELLDGRHTRFRAGAFRGTLRKVAGIVERWGAIECCRFTKGRFEDTLPHLSASPDVVVLDVDLVSSTRTCLKELWPRLRPDGVVFSLDGQLRATHELLGDELFWRDEIGVDPPRIKGLGRDKLITLQPPLVPSELPLG